jgi:hypothetical protein
MGWPPPYCCPECLALAMTGLTGGATVASAAPKGLRDCYGDSHSYSAPDGRYPVGRYLKTTSSCANISIKPKTNRYVRVCWASTGTCTDWFTYARGGSWTILETDLPDGVRFWFDFRSVAASKGRWAA